MDSRKASQGFTLIEMVITLSVLGILLGFTLYTLSNAASVRERSTCDQLPTFVTSALAEVRQNDAYTLTLQASGPRIGVQLKNSGAVINANTDDFSLPSGMTAGGFIRAQGDEASGVITLTGKDVSCTTNMSTLGDVEVTFL